MLKIERASLFLVAHPGGILELIAIAGRKLTLNSLDNQITGNRVYLQASTDHSAKFGGIGTGGRGGAAVGPDRAGTAAEGATRPRNYLNTSITCIF